MSLWLVIGLLLLMVEVITTTFFVLFFGLAALSVAVFLYFFSCNKKIHSNSLKLG
jgi:membrane protein implicated in regulation of membrane protease activity